MSNRALEIFQNYVYFLVLLVVCFTFILIFFHLTVFCFTLKNVKDSYVKAFSLYPLVCSFL